MGWELVYKYVKSIPRGRVTTYGEIARVAKLRGGAREAGHAMAATPKGQGIPWHRVVGYGGKLLIREPYSSLQRKLLTAEKIEVQGTSLDYEKYGWQAGNKSGSSSRKTKSAPAQKRATSRSRTREK